MPVETLSGLPESFTAGDTVRFRIGDSSYSATAWGLVFTLRRGSSTLNAAGAADGSDFIVTLLAADTGELPAGDYSTSARYTETATGESVAKPKRIVRVRGSLTNTTVGPRRTAYEAARAKLDSLATSTNSSVTFNGQSFTTRNLSELQTLVDRLYVEAIEEDRRLGIGNAGGLQRIVTRM
jgi:hypothetical protein